MSRFDRLKKSIKKIELNVPLKNFTTFRSGGEAKAVCFVQNLEELKECLSFIREFEEEYFILGMGSNVLVSDKGYPGIIIKFSGELASFRFEEDKAFAMGGAGLIRLSIEAMKRGLSGLEFACGIPGSIGGAVYMNAGAEGEDISGVIEEIHTIDLDYSLKIYKKSDVEWRYRHGLQNSRFIITTILKFNRKTIDIIKKKMDNLLTVRNNSQPKGFSAGSIFRNPIETNFDEKKACELIIGAGFQGLEQGDAVVSKKHANFIINRGNAKSDDIYKLIAKIQRGVLEKYGIALKPEIQFLGEFDGLRGDARI